MKDLNYDGRYGTAKFPYFSQFMLESVGGVWFEDAYQMYQCAEAVLDFVMANYTTFIGVDHPVRRAFKANNLELLKTWCNNNFRYENPEHNTMAINKLHIALDNNYRIRVLGKLGITVEDLK